MSIQVPAGTIEIGDVVLTEDGSGPHRVTGWFWDARGRIVLEWANQWHTFGRSERLTVLKEEVADRPVCEGADDAFLPTGEDPGPCSDQCPKHAG